MQVATEEKKHAWVGLDVGKSSFFAAVDMLDDNGDKKPLESLPVKEFKLTEVGSCSFLKWLSDLFEGYRFSIVMESTGSYSRKLEKFLHAKQSDLPISIENGRLTSNFIKSLDLTHKTDKIDARAIARFGTERTPAPMIPEDSNRQRMKELSRERAALVKSRTAFENRSDSLFDAFTRKINGRAIAALTLQIKALEKEIERCINENAELRHEAELMMTVPGVGKISAYGFLAELGSFRQYSSRELSAMSGLIPRIISSGSSIKKSCLSKRGPKRVRQLLYLDSVSAIKKIPQLNLFYQKSIEKGKSKMTARCACMRKLLLIIRAVVVENRPYENFSEDSPKTT